MCLVDWDNLQWLSHLSQRLSLTKAIRDILEFVSLAEQLDQTLHLEVVS